MRAPLLQRWHWLEKTVPFYIHFTAVIEDNYEEVSINSFNDCDGVTDEVKKLIKTILDEFNYKKKTPKYCIGETFYIDYVEPTLDGERVISVQSNYRIIKIDDVSYEDVYYRLIKRNGTDEILVREDILDRSKKI